MADDASSYSGDDEHVPGHKYQLHSLREHAN